MKVLLGMSGGVDSSAAAIILQQKGFEVIGLSINFYDRNSNYKFFNSNLKHNINEASKLCKMLDIKHIIYDARKEFQNRVIRYFISEYLSGRTPFPCIICNNTIKWPVLYKISKEMDCEMIATGHYVNKTIEKGYNYIVKGKDSDKDQSFFLWGLEQKILKKAIFPLGEMKKAEVLKIIKPYKPEILNKKESTGICFLKNDDYRPFLNNYIVEKKMKITEGDFVDRNGNKIGKHKGYPNYTIGQRRKLGLNINSALYVKSINPEKNQIELCNKKDLFYNEIIVNNYKIVNINDFKNDIIVKIRYRKQETPAKIEFIDNKILKIKLLEPLDSIAPGQTAVFYKNDKVIGGGFIENSR